MISEPYRILVALAARGDEKPVIDQAIFFKEKMNARLTVIHINQPALSQPKGEVLQNVTKKKLENIFIKYGYEKVISEIKFVIEYGENISDIIKNYSDEINLIILGHRKMSTFKSHIMDSVDEGISNLISCPVLIVQKS